jgi:hypothetical protein
MTGNSIKWSATIAVAVMIFTARFCFGAESYPRDGAALHGDIRRPRAQAPYCCNALLRTKEILSLA